jgi:hypothetical protein
VAPRRSMPSAATHAAALRLALRALLPLLAPGSAYAEGTPRPGALRYASGELKALLLQGYLRTSPPEGVLVRNQMYLEKVVEVNTPQQTFTIQYWSRSYWKDPRLAWNATEWPGVLDINFQQDEVWQPDEYIYETAALRENPSVTVVYPDGSAYRTVPRVSTLGCRMQMKKFPFDSQVCGITIGSIGYAQNVMDFLPRQMAPGSHPQLLWNLTNGTTVEYPFLPIDYMYFAQNAEFLITRIMLEAESVMYACCPHPYPVIRITFTFRRSSLTYVSGIVLPLIIITLVSHFGMLMGSLSGSRTGLGITAMLTTSSIYLVASASIPKTGEWTLIGRMVCALFPCSVPSCVLL